jgi:GR25 family glycosyltransferase involved in LPS biosynthesis
MIDFYCIHKENDSATQQPLTDAVNSGKQFGINVIPYPGVYSNIETIIKTKELFKYQPVMTTGELGCFLSHYLLWEQCARDNIPIGVLEYDAVFINDIPYNIVDKFDDFLHLDYIRHTHFKNSYYESSTYREYLKEINRTKKNILTIDKLNETKTPPNRNPFSYIKQNQINGNHGYIIKPSGAKKLLNATKEYGIITADYQINLKYVNMYYTSPSIVMINPNDIHNRSMASHTIK